MFHDGDLQSGIALAVQQSKAVLCFVQDESAQSREWDAILTEDQVLREKIAANAIALRLHADSQEAGFLSSFTPLKDAPTVIVIKNGTVQLHAHAGQAGGGQLKARLLLLFKEETQSLSSNPIANTINAATPERPSSPMPGAVPNETSLPPPPPPTIAPTHQASPAASRAPVAQPAVVVPRAAAEESQKSQRADYMKTQREREQKQRDERERIKQQIKADREERRRLEEVRKEQETAAKIVEATGKTASQRSAEIRVQVRTFDGSTLRRTLPVFSSIAQDIRPWIDEASQQNGPYNLKLILTPLPNRNIEASEESHSLPDLGIKGSCTFVMVPVQGYVESYTGSTSGGLIGSAVSGGYGLVTGTVGALFGGVRSMLGYGQPTHEVTPVSASETRDLAEAGNTEQRYVKVRTLADQRAEAAKKDQQFYNGNQLNFEPRKEDEKDD